VVLVTQGTIATDARDLIVPTLQALAGEDILVVATTGGTSAQDLGIDVPANARVVPFIPFDAIMPHAAAMVTNGGYGGVMIALAHGVPLVSAGISEEKPEVSNRVAYSGVGINLKTATPTSDQVKQAVQRILAEPAFRQQAQQMKSELNAYNGPSLAANLLEQLATTLKPVYAALPAELQAHGWHQVARVAM
jgi:UDP:flavonoid glycosyltransferase YjiC (YdhE family)